MRHTSRMKDFILAAANWQSTDDFYADLFKMLGAPAWLGGNLNALQDAIYGGIFTVEAPFAIAVRHVNNLPFESDRLFNEVIALFAEARRDAEIEVEFRIG